MTWISTKEAAKNIELNERHIRRLAKEGKIASMKVGKVYVIDEDSANAYKNEEHKTGPKPKVEAPTVATDERNDA